MITIAVVAQKGGVGKTTTAAALGTGLRRYHSAKVLFVDMDSQRNLSQTLNADTSGEYPNTLDVLTGRASAAEAVQHTENGDIIAASLALAGAYEEKALTSKGKEYRLRDALRLLSGSYDFCVIDTPPALGIIMINALTAADKAVLPVEADDFSKESIGDISGTLEAVKLYTNKGLQVDGVLITRYSGRENVSRYYEGELEEAARNIGSRLYNARIRRCSALRESHGLRQDIFTLAPRSNAAKDYRSLITEILGEETESNG